MKRALTAHEEGADSEKVPIFVILRVCLAYSSWPSFGTGMSVFPFLWLRTRGWNAMPAPGLTVMPSDMGLTLVLECYEYSDVFSDHWGPVWRALSPMCGAWWRWLLLLEELGRDGYWKGTSAGGEPQRRLGRMRRSCWEGRSPLLVAGSW